MPESSFLMLRSIFISPLNVSQKNSVFLQVPKDYRLYKVPIGLMREASSHKSGIFGQSECTIQLLFCLIGQIAQELSYYRQILTTDTVCLCNSCKFYKSYQRSCRFFDHCILPLRLMKSTVQVIYAYFIMIICNIPLVSPRQP